MKPEVAMWDAIRPVLKPFHPIRVESTASGAGVPDVNLTFGWIELKYANRWPPRLGPLRIDHYTKEQRGWAIERIQAGGKVFLLLKVGKNEWLLFNGAVAAIELGKVTRERLYEKCLARWTRLPKTEEISRCL
jgi:hypothetical protein